MGEYPTYSTPLQKGSKSWVAYSRYDASNMALYFYNMRTDLLESSDSTKGMQHLLFHHYVAIVIIHATGIMNL